MIRDTLALTPALSPRRGRSVRQGMGNASVMDWRTAMWLHRSDAAMARRTFDLPETGDRDSLSWGRGPG
jgi:hypothetical protein